jgi:UDP-glucose 4-epimerase
MKYLITGGAGFIGSHISDVLLGQGNSVVSLDNLSTGSMNNVSHLVEKVEFVTGDIRDVDLVNRLMVDCDVVFHMAAALGVSTILESPMESMSTNILGSEVVLSAAAKHDKRILIASTSEIYGKNPNQPLNETDDRIIGAPQKLRWSYSDSKAIEEAMARALYLEKQTRVTTVRLFNTVGPRQTGRYGMVIPRFVESALNGESVSIYGDGKQTRVFCHVLDTVDALTKIVETDSSIGEVYNLGGIGEKSITDLAKRVISLTNSKSEVKYISYEDAYPTGFEDMERRVPDISKIQSVIDWAPKRNLDQIINDVAASNRASRKINVSYK